MKIKIDGSTFEVTSNSTIFLRSDHHVQFEGVPFRVPRDGYYKLTTNIERIADSNPTITDFQKLPTFPGLYWRRIGDSVEFSNKEATFKAKFKVDTWDANVALATDCDHSQVASNVFNKTGTCTECGKHVTRKWVSE